MMIYLEGITRIILIDFRFYFFSFRWANAYTDSLGEVDVISDAEV